MAKLPPQQTSVPPNNQYKTCELRFELVGHEYPVHTPSPIA